MNKLEISRLYSQHLLTIHSTTVQELVTCMGAMQAQDYAMAKWGIGIRIPKITDDAVTRSINAGEIIRTHVMRPTWHFVSSNDIYWMLELTAPRILNSMKSRHKQLELTDEIIKKSNNLIVNALSNNNHLTRGELVDQFKQAGFRLKDNRAAHLLMRAELDGLICSGKTKGKNPTYALLPERVPTKKKLTKEEALAKLALTYFTSHGPATLKDFTWWSGLTVKDAKTGIELVKNEMVAKEYNEQLYWFSPDNAIREKNDSVYLLPAFDEFIISYKDRSPSISANHKEKTFSSNGIFWPVVLINGKVNGLWKRTIHKNSLYTEISLFEEVSSLIKEKIIHAANRYGKFQGMEVKLKFKH